MARALTSAGLAAARQALGLSQMEVVVDHRRLERAFADRIVSDPEATRLALQLIDQVGGRHQMFKTEK